MESHRRRIDVISEPAFLANMAQLDLDELRSRRRMCRDVDRELSYQRRLLHGRLDVLAFEQRRRSGEEDRSVAEALPEILGDASGGPGHVTATTRDPTPPASPRPGRRDIDFVLGDDFLTRLPDLSDAELVEIEDRLRRTEGAVSTQRRTVHQADDALGAELARRYREGGASVDELLRDTDQLGSEPDPSL